ncbi:MAG: hypothetical protein ACE5IW_03305 [bacterium]
MKIKLPKILLIVDKVEDVIESKRLVESAAAFVIGKEGIDPQIFEIKSQN